MHFPTIKGKTVGGKPRTLPADFTGVFNVVLIAFTQQQQMDVDSWMPHLTTLKVTHTSVDVYEIPTLPHMSFMQRKMLDFWMYNGITDNDVRDHTITLYTDVDDFLAPLDITDKRNIHVLLVSIDGRVHWHASGRYDAEKAHQLGQVIQGLITAN